MRNLRTFRFVILLVALAAMLGVVTASSSPAHFHAKPPANGCDICFTAHVASVEAKVVAATVHAPHVHGFIVLRTAISHYRLLRGESSLTRGPPVCPIV
jgi:hypothetical protein